MGIEERVGDLWVVLSGAEGSLFRAWPHHRRCRDECKTRHGPDRRGLAAIEGVACERV